jgi:CubicO group peptidase (beta-lactamase class C family)
MTFPLTLGPLHHLRLTVTDVDRSRAFYTELLGFQTAMDTPPPVEDQHHDLRLDLLARAADRGGRVPAGSSPLRGWVVLSLAVAVLMAVGCSGRTPTAPAGAGPAVRTIGGHRVLMDVPKQVEAYFAASATDAFRNRRAFLATVGGQPLIERYDQISPTTTVNVQSVGKSLLSTLIGIALGEHRLRGLDQTVAELLPQYRAIMNPQVEAITLRQLLTMTAGLPPDDVFYPRVLTAGNWVARILADGPVQPPDQGFLYSSAGSHLLSAILRQAVGRSVLDYARQKLFAPLGIDTVPAAEPVEAPENLPAYEKAGFAWPVDPQGVHDGGGGQKLTARDLAKLGQLWLDAGRWRGRQLVPQAWLAEATGAVVPTGAAGQPSGYGYQFWVTEADGHHAFAAQGYGGQLIEVVPDLDLVVVVQSRSPADPTQPADPGTASAEQYEEIVANLIAPAIG